MQLNLELFYIISLTLHTFLEVHNSAIICGASPALPGPFLTEFFTAKMTAKNSRNNSVSSLFQVESKSDF